MSSELASVTPCVSRWRWARRINVEFLDDVHRQTDGARLVHDRALDVLADPPGGIGGEAEAAFRIEFFQRVNQAEVALFHQVEQGKPAVGVVLGDVDHQPQVALDHVLPRLEIALHGAPRQRNFLLGRQQRRLADFVEIELGDVDLRFAEDGRCQFLALSAAAAAPTSASASSGVRSSDSSLGSRLMNAPADISRDQAVCHNGGFQNAASPGRHRCRPSGQSSARRSPCRLPSPESFHCAHRPRDTRPRCLTISNRP